MNAHDRVLLIRLCREYKVSHKHTIHELRKKIWDDANVVENGVTHRDWDNDCDEVDYLDATHPNEESIADLLAYE